MPSFFIGTIKSFCFSVSLLHKLVAHCKYLQIKTSKLIIFLKFQCSSRCGEGRRYRKVRCSQLLSLGQRIDKPEGECRGNKPWTEEQCIGVDCSPRSSAEPKIRFDSGSFLVAKLGILQGVSREMRFSIKLFFFYDLWNLLCVLR